MVFFHTSPPLDNLHVTRHRASRLPPYDGYLTRLRLTLERRNLYLPRFPCASAWADFFLLTILPTLFSSRSDFLSPPDVAEALLFHTCRRVPVFFMLLYKIYNGWESGVSAPKGLLGKAQVEGNLV